MSWFGEGLSSLKGQLQNFTKEVLSDGQESNDEGASAFPDIKRKCEELEVLCEAQNLEISALRKQVLQLQRDSHDSSKEDASDEQNEVSPWWTVEHRCDPSYSNGSKTANSPPTDDKSNMKILAFEQTLRGKDEIINDLQEQLLHWQKGEEKLESLSTGANIEKCQNCQTHECKVLDEVSEKTIQEKEEKVIELEEKLMESRKRTLELETEVQDLRELYERSLNNEQLSEQKNSSAVETLTGVDASQHDSYSSSLVALRENKEKLQESNTYLTSEMEAMAKVIQDLESQLAELKMDNESLNNSIEELDKQHQAAIEQLLDVKAILQKQNEQLQCEVQKLKMKTEETMASNTHSENLLRENKTLKKELQALTVKNSELLNEENETKNCHLANLQLEAVNNFKSDLNQRIIKLITFDIPKDFYSNRDSVDILSTVEALTRMCTDYKWKKETLERKVVEMVKEISDSKQNLNEHEETVSVLEKECRLLKRNVESLVEELHVFKNGPNEVLASIPENSEEMEAMEQKIAALENEVDVLREARSNLEADAAKLRECESNLVKQLQSTEAMLRNQENVQMEMVKYQEIADGASRQVKELTDSKQRLQGEIEELKTQEQYDRKLKEENSKLHDELRVERNKIVELREEIQLLQQSNCVAEEDAMLFKKKMLKNEFDSCSVQALGDEIAKCQNLKSELQIKIVGLEERLVAADKKISHEKILASNLERLLKITEDKLASAENLKVSIENECDDLRKTIKFKDEEIAALREKLQEFENVSGDLTELGATHTDVQVQLRQVEDEMQNLRKQFNLSEKLNNLLHQKLNINFVPSEVLVKDEADLQSKLLDIESSGAVDKHYVDQLRNELRVNEVKLAALDQEITQHKLQQETWKKQVDNTEQWQNMCHQLQSQLHSKEAELLAAKQTLSVSEHISTTLHKKLNIPYKDIRSLQQDNSSIQQKICEIENVIIVDENTFKHLNYELEQKESKIQELTSINENLKEEMRDCIQERQEINSQYQNLSSQIQIQENEKNEVLKWKELALGAERQLDDALQSKSELEKECGRLFAIEAKVHNSELLERELTKLKDLCDEREGQLGKVTLSQNELQQQCEDFKVQLLKYESVQNEVHHLKQLLSAKDKELIEKQQELFELQIQCQKLHDTEASLSVARNEISHWKSEVHSIQQKLHEEMQNKNNLQIISEKLKIAEQEITRKKEEETELQELREAVQNLKRKYDELYSSKIKLEDDFKKHVKIYVSRQPVRNNDAMASSDLLKENLLVENTDCDKEDFSKFQDSTHQISSSPHHEHCDAPADSVDTNNSISEMSSLLLHKKCHENDSIKVENMKLLALVTADKSIITKLQEDNDDLRNLRKLQDDEIAGMARETITNLSKIIKDKDMEIEALKQNMIHLQHEKEEVVKTVHIKHQESIQYHNEIQRLSGLLSQELKKSQEIQQQHEGLVQQHEDKQKLWLNTQNEVILLRQRLERFEANYFSHSNNVEIEDNTVIREGNHTDELKSIIAIKDQIIEKTVSKLNMREEELQAKQQEIKFLEEQLKYTSNAQKTIEYEEDDSHSVSELLTVLPCNTVGSKETTGHLKHNTSVPQINQLEEECQDLTRRLHEEETKRKYLQAELQEWKEKEGALQKELDRLREHLVAVEERYTQETLRAEQQVQSLQVRLSEAEEMLKSSSTAHTSASILVNQQVEALQNQTQVLTQQKDEALSMLSSAEDKVHKQEAALRNLQAVLEQFQKDKEREISAEVMKVRKQQHASEKKQEELVEEIQYLKMQLGKANEGLNAAARLGEQLDRKTETIACLREKVAELHEKLEKTEQLSQSKATDGENKVDRSLVKNLVVGYFSSPIVGKSQVLRVLASVLEMCPDELTKLGLSSGNPTANQSLSEAFIRFLENESRPQPKLRLLPQPQESILRERTTPSPSSSSTSSRRSPLLLSEVQLPTFTQFPAVRSSSSILKDVLKES